MLERAHTKKYQSILHLGSKELRYERFLLTHGIESACVVFNLILTTQPFVVTRSRFDMVRHILYYKATSKHPFMTLPWISLVWSQATLCALSSLSIYLTINRIATKLMCCFGLNPIPCVVGVMLIWHSRVMMIIIYPCTYYSLQFSQFQHNLVEFRVTHLAHQAIVHIIRI